MGRDNGYFLCLLAEGIANVWNRSNSHDGFLRADQDRATNWLPDGLDWLPYLAGSTKSHKEKTLTILTVDYHMAKLKSPENKKSSYWHLLICNHTHTWKNSRRCHTSFSIYCWLWQWCHWDQSLYFSCHELRTGDCYDWSWLGTIWCQPCQAAWPVV